MTDARKAIGTIHDLLALCRAIDLEVAEQLADLADSFEMSNNRETARCLRELRAWKAERAVEAPAGHPLPDPDWHLVDPGDPEALHYMMWPHHLVSLLVASEERQLALLEGFAAATADAAFSRAAEELVTRQRARVAELRERLRSLPEPEEGWDEDPDPPFFDQ